MNWFTYDFFDPLLPSEKWQGRNGLPVPQYVQDLAMDLPGHFDTIPCNDWSTDDYIGGIKTFGSRVCVFRVYNGGRDNRGRPHRWVLLAAENELSQWRSLDVIHALESISFKQYAAASVPSPAPFPSSAPEWQPSVRINSSALPDKLSIQGDDAEKQIRDASVWITSGKARDALLIVQKQKSQFQAWFQKAVPPSPIAQPKITDPQRTPPLQVPPENATSTTSETPNMKKHMSIKPSLVVAFVAFVVGGVLGFTIALGKRDHKKSPPPSSIVTELKLTKLDENGDYSLQLPSYVHKVSVHWLNSQGHYNNDDSSKIGRSSLSPRNPGQNANPVHR